MLNNQYNHIYKWKSCFVQIPLIAYHPFYSATKSSAVAAGIFVLHKKTDLISAPASCVHLIIIIFFVYFKLLGITDPLLPLENLFKKIFLGGILDQLQETFYGKPEEENGEASGTTSIWAIFHVAKIHIKVQKFNFRILITHIFTGAKSDWWTMRRRREYFESSSL